MRRHHLFTLCLMLVLTGATQGAFMFTAWADNRPYDSANRERFLWVISEMNTILRTDYAFHVVPGDYDDDAGSYQETNDCLQLYADVKTSHWIAGNHDTADLGMANYVVNQENVRLVFVNEYRCHDTVTGCDCSAGRICAHTLAWIERQLIDAPPFVFVVGHEPAYPQNRHEDDSLNYFEDDRNAFWQLLNDRGVLAYICGHTHVYSAHTEPGYDGPTVQIDVGNAGNPPFTESDPQTFVLFDATDAGYVNVTPYSGGGSQADSFTPIAGGSFQLYPPQGPPQARLTAPLDNGADDLEPVQDQVTVNTTQPNFQIELSDFDGIDDSTVTSGTVSIAGLTAGSDYDFAYDGGADVITLTPLPSGVFENGTYTITVSGISDVATPANTMAGTVLTVLIDTSIVPPQTLHFQSSVDTMIHGGYPTESYSGSSIITTDNSDAGGESQVLVRFDNIIGGSFDQIPPGAAISSATLRLRSLDTGNGGWLHAMLQPWSDTSTWNSLLGGDGIQADNTEALSAMDDGISSNSLADVDLDVTATVQDWVDGAMANNGWVVLAGGADGWDIASADHGTTDYHPELIVTFVVTGDRPPVADAGPDQTVPDADGDNQETVTLDGSGSYHPNPSASIVTYEWDFDGTPGADEVGESVQATLALGVHTVTLTVTDNEGATDTDAVTITVNENQSPTADAGNDRTVADIDGNELETLVLDGSGSTDADGTIVSYEWTVDGQVIEDTYGDPTDGIVTVPFALGEHTAELTVMDNGGKTGTDTALITVEVPSLFRDDFESGGFAAGGWAVTAQASVETTSAHTGTYGVLLKKASSIETTINTGGATAATFTYWARTDGLKSEYLYVEWSEDGGPWHELNALTGTTNWAQFSHSVSPSQSSLMIRFRTDGNTGNDLAMIDEVVIKAATATNQAPTADFTCTTSNLSADFTDQSWDSDGNITAWVWDFGDGTSSTAQNPSHTYASGGTYTVTLTVTDDDDATDTTSQSVTVSTSTTNSPPTADFTYTTSDLTVVFADQSSDSDGSIKARVWDFGDGASSTAQNPSHTYAGGGAYTVTLTVTDDDNATDTDIVIITVTAGSTNTVTVSHILMKDKVAGKNYFAQAVVTVRDQDTNLVGGAVVEGYWYFNEVPLGPVVSNGTAGDGSVTLDAPKQQNAGTFRFEVKDIVFGDYTYVPTVTTGSVTVP